MTRTMLPALRMLLAGGLLAGAAACAPVQSQHGYIPDEDKLSSVKTGEDTMLTVQDRLGTPTSKGTFGNETWYYITSRQERYLFLESRVIDRNVVAIEFDETQKVADVRRYTIEDGKVVNYASRETPTRGKELTFLQQMFGNVGRLPAPGRNQQGPGR